MKPFLASIDCLSLFELRSLPMVFYTVEALNIDDFSGFEVMVAKVD